MWERSGRGARWSVARARIGFVSLAEADVTKSGGVDGDAALSGTAAQLPRARWQEQELGCLGSRVVCNRNVVSAKF